VEVSLSAFLGVFGRLQPAKEVLGPLHARGMRPALMVARLFYMVLLKYKYYFLIET